MHCQPCKEQDKSSEACYWCQNCSEALCDSCKTTHKAFKLSKDHILTWYEDHKKQSESSRLDSDEADDFSFCSEHPDKTLKYFCKSHEKPICLICKRQYHRDIYTCDVESVEDAITEASVYSMYKRIYSNIDEQIASFTEIKSQKENDLTLDGKDFEIALSSLKHTRKQINACLDDLETDVRQKIEKQRNFKLAPLKGDVKKLTVSLQMLSDYKNEVQATQNNATLNTAKRYFQLINMERRCKSICSSLKTGKFGSKSSKYVAISRLEYRKLLNGIEIHVSIINEESQESRLDAEANIETVEVGSSIVELEEYPTRIQRKSVLGGSISSTRHEDVSPKPESLDSSKSHKYETNTEGQNRFRLKFSFTIEGVNRRTSITDIKLMPNKLDIAIAERSRQRVWLYNKLGQKKGYLNLGGDTHSIAVIDDRIIAISLNRKHEIAVIDPYSMNRINTIQTGEDVKGLASLNGNLYANYCGSSLICMTPSGRELWTDKSFKGDLYFYMNNDGYIFSAKMYCKRFWVYNIQNKRRSNYQIGGLKKPMGFSKDKENNILVSCSKSNRIFSKSSWHAPGTVLLDSSNGIVKPWSIDYDDLNDELLVVNGGYDIVIFSKTNLSSAACDPDTRTHSIES